MDKAPQCHHTHHDTGAASGICALDSVFCFCESLDSVELDSKFESEVMNLRI